MSIIEQIKAEIERRLSYYHPENVNHGLASGFREDGKAIAYEELLSFLDTLEEKSEKPIIPISVTVLDNDLNPIEITADDSEKPTIPVDLEKELEDFVKSEIPYGECGYRDFIAIARHFYELGCRRTAEKYDEIEYNRQIAEESVCEDLEKDIEKFLNKTGAPYVWCNDDEQKEWCSIIARHFAQWGAEHIANPGKTSSGSSEIPKDLEEAAEEYSEEHSFHPCDYDVTPYDCFIAGAKWQKEQMMKDAVEGYITFNLNAHEEGLPDITAIADEKPLEFYEKRDFKLGDKVRIIIVKED